MKNVMLMMSKVQSGGGTLLTSILVISILGVLLFLILNRNQKLKCLKRITSVALILTMLLLPFSNLLNVKANAVTITTDDTKPLASDNNFKYVTNKTNILLNNVGEYNEDATKMDTFSAYKILDVYYNETTNEMNYDFTNDFNTFKKSLDSNDEIYKLDVSGYLELTGDSSSSDDTNLTLNKLVSKYATYIRKQTSGTVSNIKFGQGNESTGRIASNIEVGSYLIIPDNVVQAIEGIMSNVFSMIGNTYTVLVGNAVFTTENGVWNLNNCEVDAKKDDDTFTSILIGDSDPNNYNSAVENGKYANDMVYNTKNGMIFFNLSFNTRYDGNWFFPANTHDSIKNSVKINELLHQRKFIFSNGLDIKNIYTSAGAGDGDTFQKLNIRDNAAYFISTEDNTEQKFADVVENDNELDDQGTTIGKSIVFSRITETDTTLLFEIVPNSNANVGIDSSNPDNSGNKIITEMTYLKDPYMDIGDNPTDEDINKVLGIATNTNIVYTYGINITNQDNNSNALSGAEFQLYSDKECTIPVGNKITIGTNGTSLYKGIDDTSTYYLKQVKAATGYRLMTDVIEVSKDKLSLTDGLYNLTITNTKMGLLPSTGGLGTILYTTFGLLMIVVGSIAFVSYRKKQLQK